MKELFLILSLIIVLILIGAIFAQHKKVPADNPIAQYDESKVPLYSLPDPLVMLNGERVTDITVWNTRRKPEILKLFEENVYGKAAVDRPEGLHWESTAIDSSFLNGSAIKKRVTIYFSRERQVGPSSRSRSFCQR